MTKEELEKIREKYNSLKNIQREIKRDLEEKKSLEEDPIVQRYLELKRNLESNRDYSYSKIHEKNDEQISIMAVNSVNPTNTTNIYIYIGTYKYSDEIDIIHGSSDYRVDKNDLEADYSLYKSLEDYCDEVQISINKREQFERDNIIIKKLNGNFYDLRDSYFKDAIEFGQEKAIEKILSKNIKKIQ